MTDDRRTYSDAEFALILRKAAELAGPAEATAPRAADGLTLAEMKAAAAEAGIDPALVERAARLLPARSSASAFERVVGGPVKLASEIHLPVALDEGRAAELLAAVQMSAGRPGTGHATPLGMVWHASDEGETLSVTAEPEGSGTSVKVRLDRAVTMTAVQLMGGLGVAGASLAAWAVGAQLEPVAGAAVAVAGIGGILGAVRTYWSASTKRVREQIGEMTGAIEKVVGPAGGED